MLESFQLTPIVLAAGLQGLHLGHPVSAHWVPPLRRAFIKVSHAIMVLITFSTKAGKVQR